MLKDRLVESSRRWAWAALDAYVRGSEDHDFAVHHAGVSAEHLLKAYLASHSPALLAGGKSTREQFNSLIGLVDLPKNPSQTPGKVHTIGLGEAFERALYLLQDRIAASARHLDPLADQRNNVAHFGLHDEAKVQGALTAFMTVADCLLSELATELSTYWGRYQPLHDAFLSKEDNIPHRIAVAAKISRAKNVHVERYGTLVDVAAQAAQQAAVERVLILPHLDDDTVDIVRDSCPACGSSGYSTCVVDIDEFIFRGEPFENINLLPVAFKCFVCELALDEPIEVILSGVNLLIHKGIKRKSTQLPSNKAPQGRSSARGQNTAEISARKDIADRIREYMEVASEVWSAIAKQQDIVSEIALEVAPEIDQDVVRFIIEVVLEYYDIEVSSHASKFMRIARTVLVQGADDEADALTVAEKITHEFDQALTK